VAVPQPRDVGRGDQVGRGGRRPLVVCGNTLLLVFVHEREPQLDVSAQRLHDRRGESNACSVELLQEQKMLLGCVHEIRREMVHDQWRWHVRSDGGELHEPSRVRPGVEL
jgi:hypothetical protein